MKTARREVRRGRGRVRPRAFTLVELLIVIGIISLLIVIGLAVGRQVVGKGKESLTEQSLRALDQVLADYMATQDGVPSPVVSDPGDPQRLIPVADVLNLEYGDPNNPDGAGAKPMNSVGLFLLQAEEVPSVKAALQGMDGRILRLWDADYGDPRRDAFTPTDADTHARAQFDMVTVLDGWGNPIRYVHPKFQGILEPALDISDPQLLGTPPSGASYAVGQVRRDPAAKDADGGLCVGGRPYFYSAGPDGDPSTVDDNVYTTRPQFSK